ncbi:tetratricopeptide repeat protein [Nitrospira sp. M1]
MLKKLFVIALSMVILGSVIYMMTVPLVLEKLIEWQCSEANPSQTCLSQMRAVGHIRSQRGDLNKAKFWYHRAADYGDSVAMFHLAWVHEEMASPSLENFIQDEKSGHYSNPSRIEVERHWEFARLWYEKSSKMGFAPSMNNLGQLYLHLQLGGTDSEQMAYRWHLAAAEIGNSVAIMNVALAHLAGQGVVQDQNEAKRWLTWIPSGGITPDLVEPTFRRTKFFGSVISETTRSRIRTAAKNGMSLELKISDIQPSSDLPTFKNVIRKMKDNG